MGYASIDIQFNQAKGERSCVLTRLENAFTSSFILIHDSCMCLESNNWKTYKCHYNTIGGFICEHRISITDQISYLALFQHWSYSVEVTFYHMYFFTLQPWKTCDKSLLQPSHTDCPINSIASSHTQTTLFHNKYRQKLLTYAIRFLSL